MCWTATSKWSEGKEPSVLHNELEAYSALQKAKDLYEEELKRWIYGWLLPYNESKYGPAKVLIPLMARFCGWNKGKVLDFREFNTYIDRFRCVFRQAV